MTGAPKITYVDANGDRYVATLREVADYWVEVSYGTFERMSKGRGSGERLVKTEHGWPLDGAMRLVGAKRSRNDPTVRGDVADRMAKAKAKREEARSLLDQYRAEKLAGRLVDAKDAEAIWLRIVNAYNAFIEAMMEEAATKSGLVAEPREAFLRGLNDWKIRHMTAMGEGLRQ